MMESLEFLISLILKNTDEINRGRTTKEKTEDLRPSKGFFDERDAYPLILKMTL
jgi:hypothetical protein